MNPYHKRKGKEGGQFTTPEDLGGEMTDAQRKKLLEKDARVKRAKLAAHIVDADSLAYSKANQDVVAKWIGGEVVPDNAPMDVFIRDPSSKIKEGLEVKTVLSNKRMKLDMKADGRARKYAWARKAKVPYVHTIAIDDTKIYKGGRATNTDFNAKGRRVFYRRDIGAFYLHNMYQVRSVAELKALIKMPTRQLPPDAR